VRRRKIFVSSLIFCIVFSSIAVSLHVDLTKANPFPKPYVPSICINSNGSITPETDMISRNGKTYLLNTDIVDYAIRINLGNIVLDGCGHSLTINHGVNDGIIIYSESGSEITNVTLKNIKICTSCYDLRLTICSHCLIENVTTRTEVWLDNSDYNNITHSDIVLWLDFGSENNIISKNNIRDLFLSSDMNLIYENNMLLSRHPTLYYLSSITNSWDNGTVGNYWSGYIGTAAYIIDRTNIDQYPLNHPIDITANVLTPTPTIIGSFTANNSTFLGAIVIVAVVAIGAGLLVYFKKRKGNGSL
jgi:hypothetical protein